MNNLNELKEIAEIGRNAAKLIESRDNIAMALGRRVATELTKRMDELFPVPKPEPMTPEQFAVHKQNQKSNEEALLSKYRNTWQQMHERPFRYVEGSYDIKFLKSLLESLPGTCPCRSNALKYLQDNPPDFSTRHAYHNWVTDFHNDVNLKKQNPSRAWGYDEAWMRWSVNVPHSIVSQ